MSKLAKALTAAAGNAGESLYVEDVFSTYLYTGTNATQTITNGIDLSGEGGLVWTKNRDGLATEKDHQLMDSQQSAFGYYLESNNANAAVALSNIITPQSDGFNLSSLNRVNQSGKTYASWTFRKAEKFFDVVTYTGDGSVSRDIPHSLNSVPACIIVKRTSSTENWTVYHQELNGGTTPYNWSLRLNSTNAEAENGNDRWVQPPTSTDFTVGDQSEVNTSGQTYVAYLFASDAGGFGDDSSESIIKCGSYTADGSGNASVNLGFEPQWLLVKSSTALENWIIIDNMRGLVVGGTDPTLYANLTNSEYSAADSNRVNINATGFETIANRFNVSTANQTYIYIAIRRPMKTPESGTEVFAPTAYSGTEPTPQYFSTGFTVDFNLYTYRTLSIGTSAWDRLRGGHKYLMTSSTDAEGDISGSSGAQILAQQFERNDGFSVGTGGANASSAVAYSFKRATGFFDVVAYTGDGSGAKSFNHNLGVIPELMIVKGRNYTDSWYVYVGSLGSSNRVKLNTNAASGSAGTLWNNTSPTATQFTVGSGLNVSAETNITYLFATLAGVSKVGSYTGNGTSLTVDCGFSNGARFVLTKRTDSAGQWMVFDTARGIVAGNDSVLYLNSTAAEYSGADLIDPAPSGFTVNWAFSDLDAANPNANGGSYIYLAIA